MTISWFRHWHGLATDPKLAFVAKKCRRPMCEVVAVFVSMLENASANESERGTLSNWDHEVVGCSLDIESMHVEAIYLAMQGKLILANKLMGWSRRQPKREDDSAERVRAHREKKRAVTQCNALSQPETLDSDSEKTRELNSLPPEQDAAREASEIQSLIGVRVGGGVQTPISPEALRKAAQRANVMDAAPLVPIFNDWPKSRTAKDREAMFIGSAAKLFANAPPEVRERCRPIAAPEPEPIKPRPVRASSQLVATLSKGNRYAN